MANKIIKDSELTGELEIRDRIRSINDQIDREESILNPRDYNKHCDKLRKLNARKDSLAYRLAVLLKASRVEL